MHKTFVKIFLIIAILACFFILYSLPTRQKNKLKKASFISQWVPQAQFAGYYLAYEKGIYKKYGLDVDTKIEKDKQITR